jgi:hypothetical protein
MGFGIFSYIVNQITIYKTELKMTNDDLQLTNYDFPTTSIGSGFVSGPA